MKKAQSLRAAIVAVLPEFKHDTDRLKIWVEDGAGRCTLSSSESFGFNYTLNVLLTEVRSDIALVALATFRWLRVNQPDLMQPGADSFSFEIDILDSDTADVLIQLALTENVQVTPIQGGGHTLDYLPEPDPLFTDEEGAEDTDPVPPLTQVLVDEDLQ